MTATQRFCTHCGQPLSPGARFCGVCGSPIQISPAAAVPTPAPPPPPPVQAEPVVTMIPGLNRRKGFMGMGADIIFLVTTPMRVILVLVSTDAMKSAVNTARERAKAEGKGMLGQVAAQMGWAGIIMDQIQSMPVDALMMQFPGTTFYYNNAIRKVTVQTPMDEDSNVAMEIIIEAGGEKIKLESQGSTNTKSVKQALAQTLGGVVR